MTRKRRLRLLLLLVLAALAGSFLLRLPALSARGLERALSSFFHREVTVREVRWRGWPLEAEVLGLRVAGEKPGLPFLDAPRILAAPALQPLWLGRIVLARLRVIGPRVRIHADAFGRDDIPRLGGEGGEGFEWRIRRLVIEDGEFQLDDRRVPVTVDLPDFRGRLAARAAGAVAGSLSFGPGRLRFGDNPELELATDMEMRLDGPLLTVETARLRAAKLELAYEGELRLGARPRGEFGVKGSFDLGMLDRHAMRSGFDIQGQARFDGRVWVDGSRLRLRGGLEGSEGAFDGVAVPRFEGQVAWDEQGVHLRDLDVEALGGNARLDVEIPPGKSVARLSAKVSEADTEGALRWIFDLGPLGIGSGATGEVALSWPRGRFRELSGRAALDLASKAGAGTPLSGRVEWRAENGVQFLERAELHAPESDVRLRGRIERDQAADLALDAETRDLAAADQLLLGMRRALGASEARRAGFSGRGEFHGRWRGTLQQPVFEGRFAGEDLGYLGVTWGQARLAGTATPDEVAMAPLELQRGDARLRVEGRIETGYFGDKDALQVRANVQAWPAEDLTRALGLPVELRGALAGDVTLGGRRSALTGELRLSSRAGSYYGVPFEELDVRAALHGGTIEVRSGRARVGSGVLSFRGALSDDGHYDGAAEAQGIEVAELLKATPAAWPIAGRVTGRVTLQGPLDRPRLHGELASPRLFLGDEGLGAVQAAFTGKGDGQVGVLAHCRSQRVDLTLSGALPALRSGAAALRLAWKDTSVDPFIRVLYPSLPSVVSIVASGEAELAGPLAGLDGMEGQARVAELLVSLPEYPVRNSEPMRFRLGRAGLRVEELHLAGEGTDLRLSGSAGTAGRAPLDLSLEGASDLRVLSVVTRRLRGRGSARLAMTVRGSVESPQVEGALELTGAGLRVRGFPTGLDGLRGTVRFSEQRAQLEDVTGSLGGGPVEVSGSASYDQGRLTAVDMQLHGRRVALSYPEGLRSVLDLELHLFGDQSRQWLAGDIDVRHALWTRRYDVASELLAAGAERIEAASLREGLRLDIRVRAPGTLEVNNNLAALRATTELDLAGSLDEPTVLGRAEIDRGRVYFQGNTYAIRRGSVDFTNPRRIDPEFSIEAETRIRSYRVTLHVSGTLGRIYPTLSSDPPLSAVQIVSLLAGADETQVASLTQSQSDQARLAAAGAATLAAGRISEEVGLERQAERLFGLNRFSIDPTLIKGDVANPTARLTVGKRITPDLNLLYSIDLKSGQEQLLSVEYTLSDRFSILLTSSELGGLGVDVRVRQSR